MSTGTHETERTTDKEFLLLEIFSSEHHTDRLSHLLSHATRVIVEQNTITITLDFVDDEVKIGGSE